LRHGFACCNLCWRRGDVGDGVRGQRQGKQVARVEYRGRLQRVSYSVPPHLLLRRLLRLRRMSFGPVDFEMAVLLPSCCAIRSVYEASAKLGMHLVQLPQGFRVQVDIDSVEGDWDDVVYAHLDGRVSPLCSIRRESMEYLGEGLQRKRRGGEPEGRVWAHSRRVVSIGNADGQYGPRHALGRCSRAR
jgi:hypothetical protein